MSFISEILSKLTMKHYIILGAAVLVVILFIVLISVTAKKNKKKKAEVEIKNEYADSIIHALGGIENVKEATLSRRRFSVLVNDINLLKPREMRHLQLGAIITRNSVKMLVKDNPKEVLKYINNKRNEGN
ncbi:MAG: hypothetical protein ACOX5X_04475 [Acholeplasmataceae bacterium]|jgi:phosphotransferase system IIB component